MEGLIDFVGVSVDVGTEISNIVLMNIQKQRLMNDLAIFYFFFSLQLKKKRFIL